MSFPNVLFFFFLLLFVFPLRHGVSRQALLTCMCDRVCLCLYDGTALCSFGARTTIFRDLCLLRRRSRKKNIQLQAAIVCIFVVALRHPIIYAMRCKLTHTQYIVVRVLSMAQRARRSFDCI